MVRVRKKQPEEFILHLHQNVTGMTSDEISKRPWPWPTCLSQLGPCADRVIVSRIPRLVTLGFNNAAIEKFAKEFSQNGVATVWLEIVVGSGRMRRGDLARRSLSPASDFGFIDRGLG